MTLYQQFINMDIDFSRLGFMAENDECRYFCTPKNGTIIGRLGVDGIHYCTADGCGDMIFAVNPIPEGDVYVYPVAKDFADFLGLVLATGSTNVLDQLYYMDRESYDNLMSGPENTAFVAAPQHKEMLQKIEELGVQPVENPFEYVKTLQAEFDYSKILFSDEFYGEDSEPVYFDTIVIPFETNN